MTSAQNHLLPLNGSNIKIALILAALITMQSCFLFKKGPGPVRPPIDPDDTTSIGITIDTIGITIDTLVGQHDIITKDKYQISVLLPFDVDHQYILDFDYDHRSVPYKPLMATEFYEGMLLAFNQKQHPGINVDVHVFDTENSLDVLKGILKKPEIRTSDLIIGPFFQNHVELAAQFALQNQIPLVAPYGSNLGQVVQSPNPYLIINIPDISSHIFTLATFMAKKYAANKMLIIRQDTLPQLQLANTFIDAYYLSHASSGEQDPIKEIIIRKEDNFESTMLAEFDTTIIFIPSMDDAFVSRMTTQLNELTEDYGLILCGLPGWFDKLHSLSLDNLSSLHFHYTIPWWYDMTNKRLEEIAATYKEMYGMSPSVHVLNGYTLADYYLKIIGRFGVSFPNYLPYNGNEYYHFEPVLRTNENPGPDKPMWIQNTKVSVIRYENYLRIKMDD